jgi:hypothetical protein
MGCAERDRRGSGSRARRRQPRRGRSSVRRTLPGHGGRPGADRCRNAGRRGRVRSDAAAGDLLSARVLGAAAGGRDGYLRARVAGALDARINWSNAGLRCQGEVRDTPPGVRLSFQRRGAKPDLLFVFGLTGVQEGRPAHAVATNLTVIVQGTNRIYGTLGDSRCTVDSLSQRRLGAGKSYRLEARGFCTQPAHAVRGDGAVLVSTFEFAGVVSYEGSAEGAPPSP